MSESNFFWLESIKIKRESNVTIDHLLRNLKVRMQVSEYTLLPFHTPFQFIGKLNSKWHLSSQKSLIYDMENL